MCDAGHYDQLAESEASGQPVGDFMRRQAQGTSALQAPAAGASRRAAASTVPGQPAPAHDDA
eukprot:10472652-Alexandrium_andersonii.AAC.1